MVFFYLETICDSTCPLSPCYPEDSNDSYSLYSYSTFASSTVAATPDSGWKQRNSSRRKYSSTADIISDEGIGSIFNLSSNTWETQETKDTLESQKNKDSSIFSKKTNKKINICRVLSFNEGPAGKKCNDEDTIESDILQHGQRKLLDVNKKFDLEKKINLQQSLSSNIEKAVSDRLEESFLKDLKTHGNGNDSDDVEVQTDDEDSLFNMSDAEVEDDKVISITAAEEKKIADRFGFGEFHDLSSHYFESQTWQEESEVLVVNSLVIDTSQETQDKEPLKTPQAKVLQEEKHILASPEEENCLSTPPPQGVVSDDVAAARVVYDEICDLYGFPLKKPQAKALQEKEKNILASPSLEQHESSSANSDFEVERAIVTPPCLNPNEKSRNAPVKVSLDASFDSQDIDSIKKNLDTSFDSQAILPVKEVIFAEEEPELIENSPSVTPSLPGSPTIRNNSILKRESSCRSSNNTALQDSTNMWWSLKNSSPSLLSSTSTVYTSNKTSKAFTARQTNLLKDASWKLENRKKPIFTFWENKTTNTKKKLNEKSKLYSKSRFEDIPSFLAV
jgi:hypothetical protein